MYGCVTMCIQSVRVRDVWMSCVTRCIQSVRVRDVWMCNYAYTECQGKGYMDV